MFILQNGKMLEGGVGGLEVLGGVLICDHVGNCDDKFY